MTGHPFNQVLRAAAGYGSAPPPPAPERPVGHLGIGRGGPGTPQPRPTSNEEINRSIGGAARLVRAAQFHGGVNLGTVNLDNPWAG